MVVSGGGGGSTPATSGAIITDKQYTAPLIPKANSKTPNLQKWVIVATSPGASTYYIQSVAYPTMVIQPVSSAQESILALAVKNSKAVTQQWKLVACQIIQ